MLSDEQHILIEKFFSEELSSPERETFFHLVKESPEFRQEVELQRSLVKGIRSLGEDLLRAELAGIYVEVKPGLAEQKYVPGKNNAGRIIKWLLVAIIAGGIIALLWVKFHHQPEEQHFMQREERNESAVSAQQAPAMGRDTTCQTTKTTIIERRDTIIVNGDKEGQKHHSYRKVKSVFDTVVKRDTLINIIQRQ